ncbi:MAG: hypothetical protein AB1758_16315 [Candidatus Eremiobacterota bacterium]
MFEPSSEPPNPRRLEQPEPLLLDLTRRIAGSVVGGGGLGDDAPGLTGLAMCAALSGHFQPGPEDPPPPWGLWMASVLVRRGEAMPEYLQVTCGARGGTFPAAMAVGQLLATGPAGDPSATYPLQSLLRQFPSRATEEQVDQLWDVVTAALRHLEKDPDPLQVRRGQQACRALFAGLQELQDQRPQAAVDHFRNGLDLLQEVLMEGIKEAFANGPTGAIAVNWTLHALVAVADSLVGFEAAEVCMEWLEGVHCRVFYEFERQVAMLEGAERLWQGVEPARAGLDGVSNALAAVRNSGGRREELGQACQQLAAAGRELSRGYRLFCEARDQLGQIRCFACGQPNSVTARVCLCGAQLLEPAGRLSGGHKSLQLKALMLACEQLQNDLLTPQEFQPVLRRAYRLVTRAEHALTRLPTLETISLEAFGAREMARSSLADYRAALDELTMFVKEQRQTRLFQGIRQLVAAGKRLEQLRDMGGEVEDDTPSIWVLADYERPPVEEDPAEPEPLEEPEPVEEPAPEPEPDEEANPYLDRGPE